MDDPANKMLQKRGAICARLDSDVVAELPAPRLPPRLQQIADAVTRLGEATAWDVLEEIGEPLSNAAVRSMLTRLEGKGVLRKRREGNRYFYRPALSSRALRRALLSRVAQQHFGGSLFVMLVELRRMTSRGAEADLTADGGLLEEALREGGARRIGTAPESV